MAGISSIFKLLGMGGETTILEKVEQGIQFIPNRLEKLWGTLDDTLVELTRQAGLSLGRYDELKRYITDFTTRVDENGYTFIQKYGKGNEDVAKMLQDYTMAVGRNINLTDQQLEAYTQLEVTTKEVGTQIAQNLTDFGIDIVHSRDILNEMLDDTRMLGINFQKAAEEFKDNLGEAQAYTFQGGIEGMRRMAQRAAEVNMSMKTALGFANKIKDVSSAIEVGSKLQVLGGPFAQMSNPLEMFYEATSDVGALQERIIGMFKNLGSYNQRTGQVELSRFNRMRVNEAANQMGINPSEMFKMINREGMKGEIGKQLRGTGLSEEDRKYIQNTATINRNGEAIVQIGTEQKKVSELSAADVEQLRQYKESDTGQTIQQMAIDLHSIREMQAMSENAKKAAGQKRGVGNLGDFINSVQGDLRNVISSIPGIGNVANGFFNGIDWIASKFTGRDLTEDDMREFLTDLSVEIDRMIPVNNAQAQSLRDGIHRMIKYTAGGGGKTADFLTWSKLWDKEVMSNATVANVRDTVDILNDILQILSGKFGKDGKQGNNQGGNQNGNNGGQGGNQNGNGGGQGGTTQHNGGPINIAHATGGLMPVNGLAASLVRNGGMTDNYYNAMSNQSFDIGGGIQEVPLGASGPSNMSIGHGEYVIRAAAVDEVGVPFLDSINNRTYANGGSIRPVDSNATYISSMTGGESSVSSVSVSGNIGINGIPNKITVELDGKSVNIKMDEIKKSILETVAHAFDRSSPSRKPMQGNILSNILRS